jgi:uncharacterized protein with GYD domain
VGSTVARGEEHPVPTYIGLLKLTDQGIRNLKDIVTAQQRGEGGDSMERGGGRVIGIWMTHGAYDAVVVGEWPDDESVSVTALSTAMQGNFRGETLRAFTAEEMQRIVQRLP